ncbi:MAG TPA: LamG-like jellyroll fold domain-containing protein [Nitrososphaeraceae archaeon]|nr:LamG-like jellyroll fold domain-containing protein [Nitrososphaeraceae archaeon]
MRCKFTCGYGTIITIFSFLVLININNIDVVYAQTTIPNFNIAAVGDWGCNSNTDKTINSINTQSPELILGLGDYSYESSADCWLDALLPIYDPNNPNANNMQISIGNHENSASEDFNTYLNAFSLTRQFGQVYSFNFNNVHFLSMATEISYRSGSSQNVFVKNDLAAAAANPNIDWIIVYFHKPMYSSPSSCSSCSGESSLRDIYHPIFDQYGVDIVLEGHTHDYQRSFPIKFNSNSKSNPIITDTNRNNYIDPAGQIHAIVGTGGVNFHSLNSQNSFIAFQQSNRFGHLNIDIQNNGTNLIGKFISNEGGILDQFTISKSGIQPPPPSSGYHYEPFLDVNDPNDVVTIPNAQELKLKKFSIAAWFKTSTNFADDGLIVDKGGLGTDTSGNNMNYGLWMTSSEKLRGGFETSSGSDRYATSPNTYNNGQWHHAVVTYDGTSIVRLYIDGVQVASTSTSSLPEVNKHPLRIGSDSRIVDDDLFIGNIDEVGIWDRALTTTEIANLKNSGTVTTSGLVYFNKFDGGFPSPPPSTNKITPISVIASTQESGKEASKAADGDFATRWSANGDGQWIEFTFNGVYPITKVGLTGYQYNQAYMFEIDGKQFVNQANRPQGTLIEYELSDLNIQSNKVRIIGHGNSGSDYNSYREIQFYTQ